MSTFVSRIVPCLFGIAVAGLPACSSVPPKPVVVESAACECPDFTAPLSPTIIKIEQPHPCPAKKQPVAKPVAETPKPKETQASDLMMAGLIENVYVDTLKLKFKAKLDTGALFTSINALDLKNFERDGKKWARFALLHPDSGQKVYFELPIVRSKVIKQLSGKYQERPVVLMNLQLGSVKENVEVTLSDRTGYLYQLLLGRNFTENRVIIDVGKSFIAR